MVLPRCGGLLRATTGCQRAHMVMLGRLCKVQNKYNKKNKKKTHLAVKNQEGKALLHPRLVCRGEWAGRGGGGAECRWRGQGEGGAGPPALPTCMQGKGEVASRRGGEGATLCPWLADGRE